MKRWFGMMPTTEITREEAFLDDSGLSVMIQAGNNGWTILYADSSSEYKDVIDTVDNNFNEALKILKSKLKIVSKIDEPLGECEEEI